MVTATDAATDLELIEHLDFGNPVACQVYLAPGKPCAGEAVWAMQCRGCGVVTGLCCNECRLLFSRSTAVFYHRDCKTSGQLPALIVFLPLGGA